MPKPLLEIERKYLVSDDSFKKAAVQIQTIAQGYLSQDPARTVRVRLRDDKAFLTVKSESDRAGIARFEYETEISPEAARQLLRICLPSVIEKERHIVPFGNLKAEVDVFHGDNEGLILAEVELEDEGQTFVKPSFLGQEVTGDIRYYNSYLAQHPFRTWGGTIPQTRTLKHTNNMFTTSDLQQLAQKGIAPETAQQQLQSFKTGFPALDITAAAAVGKGILRPSETEQEQYISAWQQYLQQDHTILKFVPASGAASRMFKDLFTYMDGGEETAFIQEFLNNLSKFAFYDELCQHIDLQSSNADGRTIVRTLLEDMHYGKLPKGLLLFHRYTDEVRTPALEHMVEGALYANNWKNEVNLHFTISPEHRALFEKHIAAHQQQYEQRYGVHYNISFSEQKSSTDTLAADAEGNPFRDESGHLVFRPGGHGALIENLGEQEADVVFIKNIDNVVPDSGKQSTIRYKQLLAGVLVTLQTKAFGFLHELEQPLTSERLDVIRHFVEEDLSCILPETDCLHELLRAKLSRPIRVCGMVRNQGEPGGGPFLVRATDGSVQCQILESSQIADKTLMQTATHFNPVDLVCGLRDYRGRAFHLKQYVDPQTAFISQKSKDGKALQALELPGLWNGAMADWNTVFVEVPIETFNPVKTVNDLLRKQHQQ